MLIKMLFFIIFIIIIMTFVFSLEKFVLRKFKKKLLLLLLLFFYCQAKQKYNPSNIAMNKLSCGMANDEKVTKNGKHALCQHYTLTAVIFVIEVTVSTISCVSYKNPTLKFIRSFVP